MENVAPIDDEVITPLDTVENDELPAIVEASVAFDDGRNWDAGDQLTETSLSRIYRHSQAAGHTSFAIMTGYRGDKELPDNQQLHAALQHDVRSARHGFTSMVGYGAEEGGKVNTEPVIFVHDIPRDRAHKLAQKYNQSQLIYAGPETGGNVHLITTHTGEHKDLGMFHPNTIAQAYAELHGRRSFVFEYQAINLAEARAMDIMRGGRPSAMYAL